MAKGTFCQKPSGRSCADSVEGDNASRSYSRSAERNWMYHAHRFAGIDRRLLWRCHFSRCDYCAVLRTTNGKGIRWGSRACSLLLADAGHNLSARAELSSCLVRSCRSNTLFYFSLLTDHVSPIPPSYFLPIFGGKSQRSFPSSDSGSTSTSATPALDSLSDAPVSPEITLVKSGSWPTSIRTFARCRLTTVRNLLLPNPGASDSSFRTFALDRKSTRLNSSHV